MEIELGKGHFIRKSKEGKLEFSSFHRNKAEM